MQDQTGGQHYDPIVVTCISDTHSRHTMLTLQPSDVLIHCGDSTKHQCTPEKFVSFANWMASQPFPHKVLIGGNHDVLLQLNHDFVKKTCEKLNIHYLRDELLVLNFPHKQNQTLKIYGTPWLSWSGKAFISHDQKFLREKIDMIPDGVDIIMTHCPPYGYRDKMNCVTPCGSHFLAEKIQACHPVLSVFGHIHEMYGFEITDTTTYVNCALALPEHKIRTPIIATLQQNQLVSISTQTMFRRDK